MVMLRAHPAVLATALLLFASSLTPARAADPAVTITEAQRLLAAGDGRAAAARFEDALRRYWIVMDPEHPGYAEVRRNLAKRQPACR